MKKNFLIGMVALVFAVSPFLFATQVLADSATSGAITPSSSSAGTSAAGEDTSHGLKDAAAAAGISGPKDDTLGTEKSINAAIGYIIGQVLTFVGVIFLILMVYGGLQWMIGAKSGKEDDIQKAQKTIYASIIGMVIVFASYAVTAFVINILTKAGTA